MTLPHKPKRRRFRPHDLAGDVEAQEEADDAVRDEGVAGPHRGGVPRRSDFVDQSETPSGHEALSLFLRRRTTRRFRVSGFWRRRPGRLLLGDGDDGRDGAESGVRFLPGHVSSRREDREDEDGLDLRAAQGRLRSVASSLLP